MKAPQKHTGRTDQMLGAMADILGSFGLPSHQWMPESCSEDSTAPEMNSVEENVEEESTPDIEKEERHAELSETAAKPQVPPENTCPGAGRTRRLSDFCTWFGENILHFSEEVPQWVESRNNYDQGSIGTP
ncbi:rho guanine nucleotide exchange factor 25 isoform X1 [Pelobates cultripes]|uniref:Rho guanine nucleotide exchange factor 25 isoform X1 n=1 Tax=Pelobates cultripes TaxID=61616 RepID=A0AAD1VR61_PELCU|nr:rho guanine nucleotide exchange factor 25 isoform X1 [Pelobates cultripes]